MIRIPSEKRLDRRLRVQTDLARVGTNDRPAKDAWGQPVGLVTLERVERPNTELRGIGQLAQRPPG